MHPFLQLIQGPIDAGALESGFEKADILKNTPQDSLYHAEGDVWTHTMMVLQEADALATDANRAVMRLSALLHDVAKPQTTQIIHCPVENRERVRQPNHAAKGRDEAWRMLTDAGVDPLLKRQVCDVIAWHQRPGHLSSQEHIDNRIARYSALGRDWKTLLDFCRADTKGRIAPKIDQSLGMLDLVEDEVARVADILGLDILNAEIAFSGPRILHLHDALENAILHEPYVEGNRPKLHLLSGLPASGKTTLRARLPGVVVSMDELRAAIKGFKHGTNDEGTVVQHALLTLKQTLAAGQDVVWDSTNLTRQQRAKVLTLGRAYGAQTHIWSIEEPADECDKRNRERDLFPVEQFQAMAQKREAIGREEAEVIHLVTNARAHQSPFFA